MTTPKASPPACDAGALIDWARRHPRLFVITGAGCSTEAGIPDYRDENGDWKRPQPVTYQAFMGEEATRRRYWARSLVGWPVMGNARPGAAHRALAQLECAGRIALLLTQNVDGLHHAAGSQRVIDLHGRIDTVRCMACEARMPRAELQAELLRRNPAWAALQASAAPDGDADLEGVTSPASTCRHARAAAPACSSPTWCSSARLCRASAWRRPTPPWRAPMRC